MATGHLRHLISRIATINCKRVIESLFKPLRNLFILQTHNEHGIHGVHGCGLPTVSPVCVSARSNVNLKIAGKNKGR